MPRVILILGFYLAVMLPASRLMAQAMPTGRVLEDTNAAAVDESGSRSTWADSAVGSGLISSRAARRFEGRSHPWWNYAFWGVPIGAVVGLTVFYVEDTIDSCNDSDMLSCRGGMVIYTIGGAAIGGVIGGVIGLLTN